MEYMTVDVIKDILEAFVKDGVELVAIGVSGIETDNEILTKYKLSTILGMDVKDLKTDRFHRVNYKDDIELTYNAHNQRVGISKETPGMLVGVDVSPEWDVSEGLDQLANFRNHVKKSFHNDIIIVDFYEEEFDDDLN